MKRFQLLGVALVAVFAFGVVIAATASATTFLLAEWLWEGGGIAAGEELSVLAEGELTLTDLNAPLIGEASVLCSGILDGKILATGENTIEELLSLNAAGISLTNLTGAALECVNIKNCPTPLVWAVNLPWKAVMELMEQGTEIFFVNLLLSETGKNPGWAVQCMGIIGEPEDVCTAPEEAAAELKTNGTAKDVEALFSEAFTELAGLKLAVCVEKLESGEVNSDGVGLITHATGGTLAVSSTG